MARHAVTAHQETLAGVELAKPETLPYPLAMYSRQFWWFAVFALCTRVVPLVAQEPSPNTLSPAEKQQGWKLLFDGKTLSGWREYRPSKSGNHWIVEDGCLKNPKGTGRP